MSVKTRPFLPKVLKSTVSNINYIRHNCKICPYHLSHPNYLDLSCKLNWEINVVNNLISRYSVFENHFQYYYTNLKETLLQNEF